MKRYIHRISMLAIVISPLIIGVSCNTSKVLELNNALTDVHRQDLKLENQSKTGQSNPATVSAERQSIDGEYSKITSEASTALQTEKDPKSRIALYRIGASAAWQGGTGNAASFYNEGNNLCNSNNRSGWSLSQRDCYMLSVIPDFEGNDEAFKGLQQLKGANAASSIKQPQEISEALTNTFLSRIKGVQSKIGGAAGNQDLLQLTNAQIKSMTCNAWQAWGLHQGTKETRVRQRALSRQIEQMTQTKGPSDAC